MGWMVRIWWVYNNKYIIVLYIIIYKPILYGLNGYNLWWPMASLTLRNHNASNIANVAKVYSPFEWLVHDASYGVRLDFYVFYLCIYTCAICYVLLLFQLYKYYFNIYSIYILYHNTPIHIDVLFFFLMFFICGHYFRCLKWQIWEIWTSGEV